MADIKSIRANNLVDHLRRAISDGTAGPSDVPLLVKQISKAVRGDANRLADKGTDMFSSFRDSLRHCRPTDWEKPLRNSSACAWATSKPSICSRDKRRH